MIYELIRIKNELGMKTDSLESYPACFFDTQETRDFTGSRMCNAGKTACTIGFDGSIRPCSHAIQTYGSMLDAGGLYEAWINMQPWRTEEYIPESCNQCPEKNLCRGGCRTEAFAVYGSLKAPDPYCNLSNTVIPRSSTNRERVDFSAEYYFHPATKYREENFGGILFVTPVRWVGVTHQLYNFFTENKVNRFRLSALAKSLGLEDNNQIETTAEMLIRKTILQKGGDKNDK